MRERELNWKPNQAAVLSILGNGGCSGPACIREFSGKRLRVAAALPAETGVAVRLEWDGQMLLGEVLDTESEGFWMEIHHMLLDTAGQTWQKQGWQR